MLGKKRAEIRSQKRKNELQLIFKQKREQLLSFHEHSQPQNFNYKEEINFNNFSHPSEKVQEKIQVSEELSQIVNHLTTSIENKNLPESHKIIQHLMKIVKRYSKQTSNHLLMIINIFSTLLKDVARNKKPINQDDSEEEDIFSRSSQTEFIQFFLKILRQFEYEDMVEDQCAILIDAFTEILQLSFRNPQTYSREDSLVWQCLKVVLQMYNCDNFVLNKKLKQAGLGSYLYKLVSSPKYSPNQHQLLLQTIYLYFSKKTNSNKLSFLQQTCSINGIHIEGNQTAEKSAFLSYSLLLIHRKYNKLRLTCLLIIILILQVYEHMSDSIEDVQLIEILEMGKDQDRIVKEKAWELIDDMVYRSKELTQFYVEKTPILDIIEKELILEKSIDDSSTPPILNRISTLICNLTLYQKNKKVFNDIRSHHIWQYIFENIDLCSPLFPLVSVYQYYFQICQPQPFFAIFDAFCNIFGSIQWKYVLKRQDNYIRKIIDLCRKKSIDMSQFRGDQCLELFWKSIRENKLQFLLQIDNIDEQYSDVPL